MILILLLVVSFQLGTLLGIKTNRTKLTTLYTEKQLAELSLDTLRSEIIEIETEMETNKELSDSQKEEFEEKLTQLQGRVAGLSTELEDEKRRQSDNKKYPFMVPTSGLIATFAGTYGGNMMGIEHWGVDIWTTTNNNGVTQNFRGNRVYSICDGVVTKLHPGNGAVTVLCDDIPRDKGYDLPAYEGVYVYYGHLGHADTKEQFIEVGLGDRLRKGQPIGYQGNISDVFPAMRNVHLHLTIYSGKYNPPWNATGGPHNPCIYIGGDCTRRGEQFRAGTV